MREFPVTVRLLDYTALQNAYHGAKICVNQESSPELHDDDFIGYWESNGYTKKNSKPYILKRIKDGHESIIEHIIFVVEVSNVSRALLQQFARHRLLSFSVQSTRWSLKSITNNDHIEFVLPEVLRHDDKALDWVYKGFELVKEMREKYGNDVAKYLIPDCTPTKMLVTGNMREWRHIYKLRKDPPAMKEFNDFCDAFHTAVSEFDPDLGDILSY